MAEKAPQIILLLEDPAADRDKAVAPNARRLISRVELLEEASDKSASDNEVFLKLPTGYGINAQPSVTQAGMTSQMQDVGFLSLTDSLGFARLEALCVTAGNIDLLSGAPLPENVTAHRNIHGVSLFPLGLVESEQQAAARSLGRAETLSAFQQGRCFDLLGDRGNALAWYRRAASDDNTAREERWLSSLRSAGIEQHRGNHDAAINWAQQAHDIWPLRNEPLLILSQLLRTSGEVGAAKRLLQLAKTQVLERPEIWHIPNDYGENIHAELARCDAQLGNDYNVIKHVNAYTQTAFHAGADRALLECRDDAYRRWIDQQRFLLPTQSATPNRFLIVIAFRNAGEYLQGCVDSIAQQTYRNYKVVLVDDCSDDGALEHLDTSKLSDVELIANEQRQGALANQVMVLSSCYSDRDIAVFVDGDDRLAHRDVLRYLNQRYQQTGCWVTFGQAHFRHANRIGYARPILPRENIADLFTKRPMVFPVHLRTHRVGLFHALLNQDPDLTCLKNQAGDFFEHASDVAHMRAMLMLAGNQRSLYIPDVLYEYNDTNPESHFRTAPHGLAQDTRCIAQLPALKTVHGYARNRLGALRSKIGERAADLILIFVEGGDIAIVNSMLDQGRLPNISRLLKHQKPIAVPEACPNDVFWRGIVTGQQVGDYASFYRTVPNQDGYQTRGFPDAEGLISVQGFWEKLAYNGHRVAVLNPSEFSLAQSVPGMTSLSNWLIHAPLAFAKSSPAGLLQRLNLDIPLRDQQRTFDGYSFVTPDALGEFLTRSRYRSAIKAHAYRTLLAQGDWSLFCFGMDAVHDALHNLWHFHDPNSPYFIPVEQNPVEELYASMDLELDRILSAGGETAVAMVLGLGGRPLSSFNSILDEVLLQIETSIRGLRPPKDPRCRWFFTMPSAPITGAVRFNLKGRESGGLVAPENVEALRNRVGEELMALRTAATDQPIVRSLTLLSTTACGPYAATLPDLAVYWADVDVQEGLQSQTVPRLHIDDASKSILDFRTGDHNCAAALLYNDCFAEYCSPEQAFEYTAMSDVFMRAFHKSTA